MPSPILIFLRLFRKTVLDICFLIGEYCPYRLWGLLISARNALISGMMSKQFGKCGNNFSIESPCFLIGGSHIFIGENFRAFSNLRLEAIVLHNGIVYNPCLVIGNNVSMNHNCHIGCLERVEIRDNVLMASNVFICDHYHGEIVTSPSELPPSERLLSSQGDVIIEDSVWIGEHVTILPGVTIGRGSIIGANCVVTKTFPPYSVIAGIPGKLIRKRD